MTNFSYTTDIPAAGNNPSLDQDPMMVNTNSISAWSAVDHLGFKVENGGTHTQITFANQVVAPSPINGTAIIYPIIPQGSASPNPQVVLNNSLPASSDAAMGASFILSCVKAFGVFTPSSSLVNSFLNSMNATISGSNAAYTITITGNAVVSSSASIFIYQSNNSGPRITSFDGTILILGNISVGQNVSFVILQN